VFGIICVPLSFGNFENTKPLQVVVALVRFAVFFCMLGIPIQYIIQFTGDGTVEHPAPTPLDKVDLFKFSGISYIFGNCIITFNCHHSLPGLVTPVRPQAALRSTFRIVMGLSCVGMVLLCAVGLIAFGSIPEKSCASKPGPPCDIQQLFNMNFASYRSAFLGKALDVYPVLMVALYPLLAITLRNNIANLVTMLKAEEPQAATSTAPSGPICGCFSDNMLFTLLAAVPMICVAYPKPNVQVVTSVTGAYFGLAIMFFIPVLLVLRVREELIKANLGPNPHASEFASAYWAYLILGWGSLCGLATTAIFILEIAGVL